MITCIKCAGRSFRVADNSTECQATKRRCPIRLINWVGRKVWLPTHQIKGCVMIKTKNLIRDFIMSIMIAELYDALKGSGASEEK